MKTSVAWVGAIFLACLLAGPGAAWAAAPARGQSPTPTDDEDYRPPQAYYVPEQEDVEEWNQTVGGPAGGWGWLGRAFKGKPDQTQSQRDEQAFEEEQAP